MFSIVSLKYVSRRQSCLFCVTSGQIPSEEANWSMCNQVKCLYYLPKTIMSHSKFSSLVYKDKEFDPVVDLQKIGTLLSLPTLSSFTCLFLVNNNNNTIEIEKLRTPLYVATSACTFFVGWKKLKATHINGMQIPDAIYFPKLHLQWALIIHVAATRILDFVCLSVIV